MTKIDNEALQSHIDQVRTSQKITAIHEKKYSDNVTTFARKNPPSHYHVGKKVLVRIPPENASVRRGGNKLKTDSCFEKVIQQHVGLQQHRKYKISFNGKSVCAPVRDITSITLHKEKRGDGCHLRVVPPGQLHRRPSTPKRLINIVFFSRYHILV